QFFDAVTGRPVAAAEPCGTGVSEVSVDFSPDSRLVTAEALFLAEEGNDLQGRRRIWELATGRELPSPVPPPLRHRAQFAPDGRLLVIGARVPNGDETMQYYDPRTGQPVGPAMPVGRVALAGLTGDGGRLLTGWESAARLRDATTGEPL